MPLTTTETVEALLASVQDDLDDSEGSFKLRTARQLLVILDEQHEAGRRALAEADLDAQTRANLEELGYL